MTWQVTKIKVNYPAGFQPTLIIPQQYGPVRYVLGKPGKNNLVCIGMNPSAASDQTSDRTVTKIINFAIKQNYDGYLMLNIYPFRATDAKQHLNAEPDWTIHQQNLTTLAKLIKQYQIKEIWGAWGDIDLKRTWLNRIKNDVIACCKQNHVRIFYFGQLTKLHNPRHPLYLHLDPNDKHYY